LVLNEHESFRINFISFRTSRDPLFSRPLTGHELFLLFLTANWL
jgi:hypothetical protein